VTYCMIQCLYRGYIEEWKEMLVFFQWTQGFSFLLFMPTIGEIKTWAHGWMHLILGLKDDDPMQIEILNVPEYSTAYSFFLMYWKFKYTKKEGHKSVTCEKVCDSFLSLLFIVPIKLLQLCFALLPFVFFVLAIVSVTVKLSQISFVGTTDISNFSSTQIASFFGFINNLRCIKEIKVWPMDRVKSVLMVSSLVILLIKGSLKQLLDYCPLI
jgi:hypothetical protein